MHYLRLHIQITQHKWHLFAFAIICIYIRHDTHCLLFKLLMFYNHNIYLVVHYPFANINRLFLGILR